jgi:hypothetical protein
MILRPALRFATRPFPPADFAARRLAAVILPPLLFFAICEISFLVIQVHFHFNADSNFIENAMVYSKPPSFGGMKTDVLLTTEKGGKGRAGDAPNASAPQPMRPRPRRTQ